MPAKGMTQVKSNLTKLFETIAGPMTEKTVTEVISIGGLYADLLTPIDTSNLINSRYRSVTRTAEGWTGKYGYTAKDAAAVHGMSGKLKGQPREHFGMTSNRSEFGPKKPEAFGGGTGVGNYWDPDAEPEFLRKGFERDG